MKAPDILLVGIGSPIGDDCIAWQFIDRLEHIPSMPVTMLKLDRPGALLLSWFAGYRCVILVDAMRGGLAVGSVAELERVQLVSGMCLTTSHDLGLADTLELGATLGLLPPQLHIIGIEIGQDGLLPTQRQTAIENAQQQVLNLIQAYYAIL